MRVVQVNKKEKNKNEKKKHWSPSKKKSWKRDRRKHFLSSFSSTSSDKAKRKQPWNDTKDSRLKFVVELDRFKFKLLSLHDALFK